MTSLTLDTLPSLPFDHIIGYLSTEGMNRMSLVNSSMEKLPVVARFWLRKAKDLAKNLGYSVYSKGAQKTHTEFTTELVKNINSCPPYQIPKDIRKILAFAEKTTPTMKEVCKLLKFTEARNKLVFWESVAAQAQIHDVDFSRAYESVAAAVAHAKGLEDWIDQNKTKLQALQTLNLNNKQLTKVPDALRKLTGLTSLDLSHNQLHSVPSILGGLTRLTTLKLSHNKLKSIPKELRNLANLMTLSLSHNQLTEVPEKLGSLARLMTLRLSHNQLTSISDKFGELEDLISLNLSHNQLTSIPEKLKDSYRFDFSANPIPSIASDLEGEEDFEEFDLEEIRASLVLDS